MRTEVLRIIEGGLTNDRRKIISYSNRLADRLSSEGQEDLAKCIRQKLDASIPNSGMIADALRTMPLDSESRLQIVEVIPPTENRQKIVLSSLVKKQIEEFISMIKHQSELELAGIDTKLTMLLYGMPGCGKTSVAHYISEQAGLPLVIARLDGIVSSLLGSTAKNIRKIFDYAQSTPCILFLDEFDAIAKARDDAKELGELKRVINSLLQNIDSMPSSCVLLAATNHPEMLDKAVWRRFVQKVEINLPDNEEIKEMINIFTMPFSSDFGSDSQKIQNIINSVHGLSPSDIRTIFDRAKIKSVIDSRKTISYEQLLLGVFDYHNNNKTEDCLVNFLSENGVTQSAISKITDISLRKVKQILSMKK